MLQPPDQRPACRRPDTETGKPAAANPSRRILLVQTSYLGDTILSTPLIAALHQLHPRAELWMMTTPAGAELVQRDPRLQKVIAFDKRDRDKGIAGLLRMSRHLRRLRFDRAYALQRSYRTALMLWLSGIGYRTGFRSARGSFLYNARLPRNPHHHDVRRNLSLLTGEAPLAALRTEMRLFPPSVDSIDPGLARHIKPQRPYVLLVPGSAWATKRWHGAHYRVVADRLIHQGYRVILMGAAADQRVNRQVARGLPVVDLTARTSVAEAMTLGQHAA
ncbi:MAG: glycosyltransferase family 9 protein, partial [Desulfosarcina sp.]|nr:glycosyltransferase family 9 protein [Desulfobacterales bacterium]